MSTVTQPKWIKRRSELEGFSGALYCVDATGEYVRVDYSIKDKKARLTVEDRTERRFHSLIVNSAVQKERVARQPSGAVAAVMKRKAHVYSTLRYMKVLALIQGCYGIRKAKPGTAVLRTGPRTRNVVAVIAVIAFLIIITAVLSHIL